jgi:hypothetical protein
MLRRLILSLMLGSLVSCISPTPVHVSDRITIVPGLGFDQTSDIQTALKGSEGSAVIGFSFGAEDAITLENTLSPKVLILIEPVSKTWSSTIRYDGRAPLIVLYRSETLGPPSAQIIGPHLSITVDQTGHNTIPHDPRVLMLITEVVR